MESDERKKALDHRGEAKGEFCCGCSLWPRRPKSRKAELLLSSGVCAASKVSLPQVARVLSEVYGDRMASHGSGSDAESFPLQQKLLVCCLLLLIRNGKTKEVVLGKVRCLLLLERAVMSSPGLGFADEASPCVRVFSSSTRCTVACALGGRCLRWVRESVCLSAVCWRAEESLH